MFFRWNVGMVKVSGFRLGAEASRAKGQIGMEIQFTVNNDQYRNNQTLFSIICVL